MFRPLPTRAAAFLFHNRVFNSAFVAGSRILALNVGKLVL
ncbi:hypothetical protein CLV76_103202 [Marivita geojedonensis]|nr:hypothetical protein CLV76_103202 [Marivita geojedonensis]